MRFLETLKQNYTFESWINREKIIAAHRRRHRKVNHISSGKNNNTCARVSVRCAFVLFFIFIPTRDPWTAPDVIVKIINYTNWKCTAYSIHNLREIKACKNYPNVAFQLGTSRFKRAQLYIIARTRTEPGWLMMTKVFYTCRLYPDVYLWVCTHVFFNFIFIFSSSVGCNSSAAVAVYWTCSRGA